MGSPEADAGDVLRQLQALEERWHTHERKEARRDSESNVQSEFAARISAPVAPSPANGAGAPPPAAHAEFASQGARALDALLDRASDALFADADGVQRTLDASVTTLRRELEALTGRRAELRSTIDAHRAEVDELQRLKAETEQLQAQLRRPKATG